MLWNCEIQGALCMLFMKKKKNLLVAQEEKQDARGHQMLQEPSPADPKLEKGIYFLSLNRKTNTSKCGKNSSNALGSAFCTTFWCHLWSITEQTHSSVESIC